jgi:hypothetical protein
MKEKAGFQGVWRHAASCRKASALPHLTAIEFLLPG